MNRGPQLKTGFLDTVQWVRASGIKPRGIILVPPLIGGHALQQIRTIRLFVHCGFDLISFNYAGHGDSSGSFSFQTAIDNCLLVLDWSMAQSRKEGQPLYGLAACFGALPLIHAVALRDEPLSRIILISALPHWHWEKLLVDFLKRWACNGLNALSPSGLAAAIHQYLDDLFPKINHRKRSFGILSLKRMHWIKMAYELCLFHRQMPAPLMKTPVLCIYGRQDKLLNQIGYTDLTRYEIHLSKSCPKALFCALDSDHFFSSPILRYRLLRTATDFFNS